MPPSAQFAKRVFLIAGVAGLLVLTPLFFTLDYVGQQYPPAVNHPEFYYDFVAITLAWQVGFLIIATNPVRFRPMMIAGMLEKAGHITAMTAMYVTHQIPAMQYLTGMGLDVILGVLFVLAYRRTPVAPVSY